MTRSTPEHLKASHRQTIYLVVSYTLIIVGTMYLSGRITHQTLYNIYSVKFEGVKLPVSDRSRSRDFYQKVLDLYTQPVSGVNVDRVRLPGKRYLFLENVTDGSSVAQEKVQQAVLINVRNGFSRLHEAIVRRAGGNAETLQPEQQICTVSPGKITTILKDRSGRSFAARDPDGNCLVFFQPRNRMSSWR